MNEQIENVVISVLKMMGVETLLRTFALCEGRVVAQKFSYDGGYAVWIAGSGTISIYDADGRLLRSLHVAQHGKAA
jgi:hypothetical protein